MKQTRGARLSRVLLFALSLASLSATAQSPEDRLKSLLADPAARAAAAEAGKKAAFFCANCHGDDGNSKLPDVPNLAGQNAAYLLEQIRKFSTGQRRNEFMQGLMKVLSDSDRANIAVHYASMNVTPSRGSSSALGGELFTRLCARCHGEQARGGEKFPRLAGQQFEYLVVSLTRYRDRTGERIDPLMLASTTHLKNQDIQALATYLAAMR